MKLKHELQETCSHNDKYVNKLEYYKEVNNQLAGQVQQECQIEADQVDALKSMLADREEALESMISKIEYLDTRQTEILQNNVRLTLELDEARKEIERLKIKEDTDSTDDTDLTLALGPHHVVRGTVADFE